METKTTTQPREILMPVVGSGDQLMISTGDRRHAFLVTVTDQTKYVIHVKTPRSWGDIVLRDDGTISHFSRDAVRRGCFPTVTPIHTIKRVRFH